MASIDITISAECSECGQSMDIDSEKDGHDRYGWQVLITVGKCKKCSKDDYEEGYKEGFSDCSSQG